MKIETRSTTQTFFGELECGDAFEYEGGKYMKIEDVKAMSTGNLKNAVTIKSGYPITVAYNAYVVKLDGTFCEKGIVA